MSWYSPIRPPCSIVASSVCLTSCGHILIWRKNHIVSVLEIDLRRIVSIAGVVCAPGFGKDVIHFVRESGGFSAWSMRCYRQAFMAGLTPSQWTGQ